ncbi:hypothetical protein [Azospirillum sp. ST 5-10]|uniref:hypothetical protein n=1 Tax=unclassified Azospirillum TaxID=2630922 RepID=UPI003F4A1B1E
MMSPVERHHDHFRLLYFGERSNRETIRGSVSTPVAAISFTVFSLGTLAREVDASRWTEPLALVILGLGAAAVLALLCAVYHVILVEWLFVHHEPPTLTELLSAEEQLRAAGTDVPEQTTKLMTASYAIAYQQYLCGNIEGARHRTWALRLILGALACLALAFVLLPAHLAG